ncbi:MAG: hypothetical protein M1833_001830 [Piccolia ochrophora]|nr:MAG: hypothetical protein M1833_001830 [Piccolia ochrophora]
MCAIGYIQLRRHYTSSPPDSVSANLSLEDVPHITVLRPIKGLEPSLYDCLAATFHLKYPREKLTIHFCIPSRHDPAFPILERLLTDFPSFDARLFVEEEDPKLRGDRQHALGPNPKIRNMSRGYREAKGDIIWVVDCNVWVGKGVAGRMVDRLCGLNPARNGPGKFKFVHQLPVVVDIATKSSKEEVSGHAGRADAKDSHVSSTSTEGTVRTPAHLRDGSSILSDRGGRLEELFLASSHAKFYTAINTVLFAPCIIGKSNMFRRSHLDYLTSQDPHRPCGIDYFSENICEDHLIGDMLWKQQVLEEKRGETWGKHALVFGDLVIQPMAGMSVTEYIARRVRWLRVRKFTVTLATLVEPGTESFLCSVLGAYAITTLPYFSRNLHIPSTYPCALLFFLLSISFWACVDWSVYCTLHSAGSIEVDEFTPAFARPPPPPERARRPFQEWFLAWLGREALAFPIWAWAVLGGTTVAWRGKRFWVGVDMRVHEIGREERFRKARVE